MKISIMYPDRQPASLALAQSLAAVAPPGAVIVPASEAAASEAEMILAVFTLRRGTFAPAVDGFRKLRDKKVVLAPILTGEIDRDRAIQSFWDSKGRFRGNRILGVYLCPAEGAPGRELVAEHEAQKVRDFVARIFRSEMNRAA